jgi:hypothetical protein
MKTTKSMDLDLTTSFSLVFSAHIIPGLFLLSISYLAFNPYLIVVVMTLSLGFNGAATMTNLQNCQDLAPNYAGTLYGIINFVGTSSGFISPMIVAHFTEHEVNSTNSILMISQSENVPPFTEHNQRVAICFLDRRFSVHSSSTYLPRFRRWQCPKVE